MSSKLVNKEGNKVNLTIEVAADRFEGAVQTAYMKNRKKFNMPGFRKGKAPRKVIEMTYGKGVFYEEAINTIFPEVYGEAIKELDLKVIDRPSLDLDEIKDGEGVTFKVEVEVQPEVELGEYKGVEVEKILFPVGEEEVQNGLKAMQERNARIIDIDDRETKSGDVVVIDYSGFVGEEQFEGGTAEGQELELGSNSFIPGFEDQLVGKNKGEDVDVKVTFPEEYHSDKLAGQDAIFKVKIHEIKEKELPELDDEFAKDVSEFDTLEELKADMKAKLEEKAKLDEEQTNQNNVVEKVVELTEVEVPETMVEQQMESEMRNFEMSLMYQGLTLDKYLELTGSSKEAMQNMMRPKAVEAVKTDLVLGAIETKEEISASDEELDAEIVKMAEQYNQELDKFKGGLREEDMDYIKANVTRRKTVEFLVENAKLS